MSMRRLSGHLTMLAKLYKIESVQRRFTKRLPGHKYVIYKDRLQRLGLETLEMRRLREDLVFAYKVILGLVSNSCYELFIMSNSSISTRGHDYKLFQSYTRVDSRKHFFAERIIKPWNSLPANNDTFKSFASCKSFVYSANLTNFVLLGF